MDLPAWRSWPLATNVNPRAKLTGRKIIESSHVPIHGRVNQNTFARIDDVFCIEDNANLINFDDQVG